MWKKIHSLGLFWKNFKPGSREKANSTQAHPTISKNEKPKPSSSTEQLRKPQYLCYLAMSLGPESGNESVGILNAENMFAAYDFRHKWPKNAQLLINWKILKSSFEHATCESDWLITESRAISQWSEAKLGHWHLAVLMLRLWRASRPIDMNMDVV